MRRNFYSIIKKSKIRTAAATGDFYTDLFSGALAVADWPTRTITGVPPIRFISDGSALSAWSIDGNAVQDGTPAPDAPVSVYGCGDLSDGKYTVSITFGGQIQPVYLGSVQTTRRIWKLVLTGDENWMLHPSLTSWFYCDGLATDAMPSGINMMCNHFVWENYATAPTMANGRFSYGVPSGTIRRMIFKLTSCETADNFKIYLQQQYAAGTPVCVWYVLANEQTGIVNEPLMRIGTYADTLNSTDAGVTIPTVRGSNTLTVDTAVQPSEMTITGHIKSA